MIQDRWQISVFENKGNKVRIVSTDLYHHCPLTHSIPLPVSQRSIETACHLGLLLLLSLGVACLACLIVHRFLFVFFFSAVPGTPLTHLSLWERTSCARDSLNFRSRFAPSPRKYRVILGYSTRSPHKRRVWLFVLIM